MHHRRLLHRVGQVDHVLPGALRGKEEPGGSGESRPLDDRSSDVAHEGDERPPRPRIVEGEVDLACGLLELDIEPDPLTRLEDEELREFAQRERHRHH